MIELPALAPFDMETDFEGLSATAMLGRSDEIYADGMPGWKHNPGEMGVGLQAFVRAIRPVAMDTPKIDGPTFIARLMALGVDASGVVIVPNAIPYDTSVGDEAAYGE